MCDGCWALILWRFFAKCFVTDAADIGHKIAQDHFFTSDPLALNPWDVTNVNGIRHKPAGQNWWIAFKLPMFFLKGFPEIWFGFVMDTTSIQHNLGWCGGRVVCDESSLHKTNLVVREPVRNQWVTATLKLWNLTIQSWRDNNLSTCTMFVNNQATTHVFHNLPWYQATKTCSILTAAYTPCPFTASRKICKAVFHGKPADHSLAADLYKDIFARWRPYLSRSLGFVHTGSAKRANLFGTLVARDGMAMVREGIFHDRFIFYVKTNLSLSKAQGPSSHQPAPAEKEHGLRGLQQVRLLAKT